jgi:flagellar hook-length control protein FliK
MALQEPAGQNALAGEEVTAFAMAVDEAVAQGELKGIAGVTAQGELMEIEGVMTGTEPAEKKDKDKLDAGLCASFIPALLAPGVYQIQQSVESVIADQQPSSLTGNEAAENKEQMLAIGGSASGSAVQEAFLPKSVAPEELNGFMTAKDSVLKETTVGKPAMPENTNTVPEQVLKAAKEKSELDHADFMDVQKTQAQSSAKAAQFVGNGSARETVNPMVSDFDERVHAIRGMAAIVKQDKDKGKNVQMPAVGLVMVQKAEQIAHAAHTEGTQSAKDAAPENAAREENAAMQVARASLHALRRGMTEYRVRLSPEGLGDVEVTVVTKGKTVSMSMRTDNEAARGLILGHADELRTELNQQDYHVSGLSVEVGTDSGNGAGFFMPKEHTEPMFETGRLASDQDSADTSDARGQPDSRVIMPRSSTISYRV